ncbi:hypothetical protein LguiA_021631 [Lonicera macranthoides]
MSCHSMYFRALIQCISCLRKCESKLYKKASGQVDEKTTQQNLHAGPVLANQYTDPQLKK